MGFFKFVFILLIIAPIAVLMIYFINNLNDELKANIKNAAKQKRVKQNKKFDSKYGRDGHRELNKYRKNIELEKQKLGGSFNREILDRDRYKRETPYYIKKQEKMANEESRIKKDDRGMSKRKRRKQRKNKRKVREK